jgi:hypothetical protein
VGLKYATPGREQISVFLGNWTVFLRSLKL